MAVGVPAGIDLRLLRGRENDEPLRVAQRQRGSNRREVRNRLGCVGPSQYLMWALAVEEPDGHFLPVNADIPTDIQVHFVDDFDAHASPTGACGIGELGATGVAAAVAVTVYDAVRIRIRDLPITLAKLRRLLIGPFE